MAKPRDGCGDRGGLEDMPDGHAYDLFVHTRDAAATLGLFLFFTFLSAVLLVTLGWMVYRAGTDPTVPPPSVQAILVHPANTWLVTGVVQPALGAQITLLVALACGQARGTFSEIVLAAATTAAYAYTVLRADGGASLHALGLTCLALYAAAWPLLLRDMRALSRPFGPVPRCALLYTLGCIYLGVSWMLAPDAVHTHSPIILLLGLAVTQPVFVVPMLNKITRDLCITEYV